MSHISVLDTMYGVGIITKRVAFFILLVVTVVQIIVFLRHFNTTSFHPIEWTKKKNTMPKILRKAVYYAQRRYKNSKRSVDRVGYILATHYVDQLSGSIVNFFSLQCWASTLPGIVKAVEPFLHYGSMLGFQLEPTNGQYNGGSSNEENTIRLFDMFDEQKWKEESYERNYADLVSWNYFLKHSPKQLILVDKVCSDNSLCMACEETNFFESPLFFSSALKFAKFYNFSIVRQTCYEHREYFNDEFIETVYGTFNPDEVVVIFNHFGGFENEGDILRIPMDQTDCFRSGLFSVNFPVHQKILHQSRQYVKKFMPRASRTGYISVMFRTEHFARSNGFDRMHEEMQLEKMEYCVDKIVDKVNMIKEVFVETTAVFLSTDMGKYGSAYFRKLNASHFFQESVLRYDWNVNDFHNKESNYFFHEGVQKIGLENLHKELFGRVIKLDDRIDSVVLFRSPGYVAILEMVLATNGTCVVLAGGGMFQQKVGERYQQSSWHDCGVFQVDCTDYEDELAQFGG